MLMTTGKLIGLRLFNVTLGRNLLFDRLLRRYLVKTFVYRRAHTDRYNASSQFFVATDLDDLRGLT